MDLLHFYFLDYIKISIIFIAQFFGTLYILHLRQIPD